MNLKFEENSIEEDRQEIFGELIKKACEAFDVYDEHQVKFLIKNLLFNLF